MNVGMKGAGQCCCGKRVPQCLLSGHVQEEKQARVRGGEAPWPRESKRGHCVRSVAVPLGSMGGLFLKGPRHLQGG